MWSLLAAAFAVLLVAAVVSGQSVLWRLVQAGDARTGEAARTAR